MRGPLVAGWIVALVVAGACSGEDERPPSVTPEPSLRTVTAVPTQAQVTEGRSCDSARAACDFAAELGAWVASGDMVALLARFETKEVACPGPAETGVDLPEELCVGALPGEVRSGFLVGNESRSVVYPAETLLTWGTLVPTDSGQSDRFGSGGYRLASLGCPNVTGTFADCGEGMVVVFTGISPDGGRFVRVFTAVLRGTEWMVVKLTASGLPWQIEVMLTEGTTGPQAPVRPAGFKFYDWEGLSR